MFGNTNEKPPLDNIKKYFPYDKSTIYTIYTDNSDYLTDLRFDRCFVADPESIGIMRSHPRYGWRASDYYRGIGLRDSPADVALYFDNDMLIVSDKVKAIVPMTKRFGVCMPMNPRYTVYKDATIGTDVTSKTPDDSLYMGHATNQGILSCSQDLIAKHYWNVYCNEFLKVQERAGLVQWRAIWETGFMPCILPPQWCVCSSHVGVGDEVVLHIGHKEVKKYYKIGE